MGVESSLAFGSAQSPDDIERKMQRRNPDIERERTCRDSK